MTRHMHWAKRKLDFLGDLFLNLLMYIFGFCTQTHRGDPKIYNTKTKKKLFFSEHTEYFKNVW